MVKDRIIELALQGIYSISAITAMVTAEFGSCPDVRETVESLDCFEVRDAMCKVCKVDGWDRGYAMGQACGECDAGLSPIELID